MREIVRRGLAGRWTPARRWWRGELRVAPLELVLALRRPNVLRLATVVRLAANAAPASPAAPATVRELRLLPIVRSTSVQPGPRETRIEATRHTRLERTVVTHHSRYERIEAGAPRAAVPGHPVRHVGAGGGAVASTRPVATTAPMPAVVLARAPATPVPTPPAVAATPAATALRGAPGPAGPAGASAVTPAAPDIEAIANQVLRRIERRAIAQRERMGRV